MVAKRKPADGKKKKAGQKPQIDRQRRNRFILAILGVCLIVVITFMISRPRTETPGEQTEQEAANAQPSVDISLPGNTQFEKDGELTFITTGGIEISQIDIEIAQSRLETMQGLMYRSALEHDQGMLFIFPIERPQSFWMKNTQIPLDIIFINGGMTIVTIHKDAVPFDESSYPSSEPAKFVVEVNAGYSDKNGIKVGDKIKWTESL